MDSLGKKEVKELLKTAPPKLAEVLVLRQQLAKSSVRKYTAMENAVCDDSRQPGTRDVSILWCQLVRTVGGAVGSATKPPLEPYFRSGTGTGACEMRGL